MKEHHRLSEVLSTSLNPRGQEDTLEGVRSYIRVLTIVDARTLPDMKGCFVAQVRSIGIVTQTQDRYKLTRGKVACSYEKYVGWYR